MGVMGVGSILTVNSPDVLVGGGLKQIAFRAESGYVLARGRPSSMVPELWANGLGQKQLAKAQAPEWLCEDKNCVANARGVSIAFPKDPAAFAAQCGHASILFTRTEDGECAPTALITSAQLSGSSVTALWLDGGMMRRETSADWQGARPWSVRALDERGDED